MSTQSTFNAKALFHNSFDKLVENNRTRQSNVNRNNPLGLMHVDGGNHAWLLTDLDPKTNIAFGLCDLGAGFPELGYVDLNEVNDVCTNLNLKLRFKSFENPTKDLNAYISLARQHRKIELFDDDLLVDSSNDGSELDAIFSDEEVVIDEEAELSSDIIPLNTFLDDYRSELLSQVDAQIPPVFQGLNPDWDKVLEGLFRQPITKQRDKIHAVCEGLLAKRYEAVILNGEMGTGKTYMGIATSAIYHRYNPKPTLVMCPPHLVYKWRREILDTIPNANVMVINGSDAINRLLDLRERVHNRAIDLSIPQFIVIGRVRMRMGFYWRLSYNTRSVYVRKTDIDGNSSIETKKLVICPECGCDQVDSDNEPYEEERFKLKFADKRTKCKACGSPMWTMHHRDDGKDVDKAKQLEKFLCRLPGIGKISAQKLILKFGEDLLTSIIDDNIYDFVNLMDEDGEYVFSEKKSQRIERALGRLEFALRFISYQPSEFVKRYLPKKFFGLAIADEAHEYKNSGSAQGQAFGVLASCADQLLNLTGTLMGGYASDLFYLLFRSMPGVMVEQSFRANEQNSLGAAEMKFMREYGVLIDVMKTSSSESHRTAKGTKTSVSVKKAPGFSPVGIAKFVLPYTVFIRLKELGNDCLPTYEEHTHIIDMSPDVAEFYQAAETDLVVQMRDALRKGDKSLLGLVMNFLLRWPDTVSRAETLVHPQDREDTLLDVPSHGDDIQPKEQHMIDLCVSEVKKHRRVLVYSTYTGKHDTASRLKALLSDKGLKVAVLRSTVSTEEREDWIANKVEQGVDVLICNPELVKTGLDLLAFPTIYFMQTGFNTYTVEQAARRSWRIGQDKPVHVHYAGYNATQQIACLQLMAAKIKVNQSTSGVMPDSGLDIFEEEGEASLMTEIAKNLLSKHR